MRNAIVVLVAAGLLASPVLAQNFTNTPKWTSSLALGATLTRGNSDTLLANLCLTADRKGGRNEWLTGFEGNYGESETTRSDGSLDTQATVANAKSFVKFRRLLTELSYASFNVDVSHDDIADLRYRIIAGPGVGHYIVRKDARQMNAEIGVVYIEDNINDVEDDRIALKFQERYDWKLSDTAKLWQSLEYLPSIDDFDQYLLNAELGAEASLNDRLSLRLVLQDKYDSHAAINKEYNDLTLIAGLSCKL